MIFSFFFLRYLIIINDATTIIINPAEIGSNIVNILTVVCGGVGGGVSGCDVDGGVDDVKFASDAE